MKWGLQRYFESKDTLPSWYVLCRQFVNISGQQHARNLYIGRVLHVRWNCCMGHGIHSKVNPVHEWHGWFWIRLIHTFREADKLSSGLLGVPKQSVNEARVQPLCTSWSRWRMWKNIRIQDIWPFGAPIFYKDWNCSMFLSKIFG